MHNDDLSTSILSFMGTVDCLPTDAQNGSIVITSTTQTPYVRLDSQWIEIGPTTISSPPVIEYLKPELAVCECCGAPLKGDKCEYCGSTYIWR